jgi:hypothetical protein
VLVLARAVLLAGEGMDGRNDDVVLANFLARLGLVGTAVLEDGELFTGGAVEVDLALPLFQDSPDRVSVANLANGGYESGPGGDDERVGAGLVFAFVELHERDSLKGLAEAHVVGEDAAGGLGILLLLEHPRDT